MATRVCPRCVKSRETVKVDRKDTKKKNGKTWRIEVCPTCSFNFDLEEVKPDEATVEPDKDDGHGYPWQPYGRW